MNNVINMLSCFMINAIIFSRDDWHCMNNTINVIFLLKTNLLQLLTLRDY